MRRLARELDVTPGALYWHFANKQQLLGAVADEVLRPACADAVAQLTRAATDAGLNPAHADQAARSVVYYVLGFTTDEQSRLQWDAAGALPDGQSVLDPIGGDPVDPGAAFEFGLGLLIDGI